MNDRNKTPLTHRVTAVAAACLNSIGCKPVETEVEIAPGWVADVASYWYPSRTEAKHFRLQEVSMPRRLVDEGDDELNLAIRASGYGPLSVIVEVKTAKNDFSGDRKWRQRPPAHICILAFPSGIVDTIPDGWYGLETSTDGSRVRKWHRYHGEVHPQHMALTLDFVAQVGIRRDHRTRGRALRDWAKAWRVQDGERKTKYSTARLIEGLANWLQGRGYRPDRPLREVLPELGVKKVPEYLNGPIVYFESLKKP